MARTPRRPEAGRAVEYDSTNMNLRSTSVALLAGGLAAGVAISVMAQGSGGSQPLGPEDTGAVGRYQMVHIQEATDVSLWMIDSCTGRIWKRYSYPDGDHWTQTIREDYPLAAVRLQGMPPKPPSK